MRSFAPLLLSRFLAFVISSCVFSVAALAATPKNRPQRPIELHRLFTPFWTIEGGHQSVMQIHNNSIARPLEVKPVLLSDVGERVELPAVPLGPLQNASVNIREELRKLGKENIASGSAVFEYLFDHGGAIAAEISVSEPAKSLIYTIISAENGAKSKRLSSVYWFPRGSGGRLFVALQNTTNSSIAVTGTVDENGKAKPLGIASLAPLQSTVMWADVTVSDLNGEKFGGVALTHDAPEGGLHVSGWLEMASSGYSNMMIFDDPGKHRGTTLYGTQIFLGARDDLFASKRVTAVDSRVVLSNSSDGPIVTDVDLVYEVNGDMVHVPTPVGTLAAHQIKSVDLNTARISADGATGSLIVHYNGPEGAVMGRIFGVTDRASIGFYSALETYTPAAVSEAYWTTEGDTESLLTVTNFDDKADKITIVVTHAGGGKELAPIELKPLQSTTIKLRELKQRGLLPIAEFGGFRVFGSSTGSKLLIKEHVISENAHMAAPFYGEVTYVVAWWIELDNNPVETETTTLAFAYAWWSDDWVDLSGFSSLESNNESVAAIGDWYFGGYQVHGVGVGNTTLDGVSGYLPCNPDGTRCYTPDTAPIASSYKCFAKLMYRPTYGTYNHAFWYFRMGSGVQYITVGGPENADPPFGHLHAFRTPALNPHFPLDNISTANTHWDSGASFYICYQVGILYLFSDNWPHSMYNYTALSQNSNMYAREANEAALFGATAPPNTEGW